VTSGDAGLPGPLRIVVMGVAASGKTTVAKELALRLRSEYIEGDDFHPPANIAKMSNGIPLSDADRWPWLSAMCDALASHDRVVVTCSALKKSYRDLLRGAGSVRFIYLDIDHDVALTRITARKGHFMTSQMIDSQFATLEVPGADEPDVVRIDAGLSLDRILADCLTRLH
jgi:carbohydrate kinase (thermoresistant glucokinase family)